MNYHNLSTTDSVPEWDPEAPCMDSSQDWFCRDLWIDAARDGMANEHGNSRGGGRWLDLDDSDEEEYQPQVEVARKAKRDEAPAVEEPDQVKPPAAVHTEEDSDANAGSDYDAMPDSDVELPDLQPPSKFSIPNSSYKPARILINPRCVTTYTGISHTKLARELFGDEDEQNNDVLVVGGKYVLDDWDSAPDSFVCQEQRYICHYLIFSIMLTRLLDKREAEKPQRLKGALVSPSTTNSRKIIDMDTLSPCSMRIIVYREDLIYFCCYMLCYVINFVCVVSDFLGFRRLHVELIVDPEMSNTTLSLDEAGQVKRTEIFKEGC